MITKEILSALKEEVDRLDIAYRESLEKSLKLKAELKKVEEKSTVAENTFVEARNAFRVFEVLFKEQNKDQEESLRWLNSLKNS